MQKSKIPDIEIEVEAINQQERKEQIIKNFSLNKIISFKDIFNIKLGRENVIVSFLIILDMIKEGVVKMEEKDSEIQFEYKDV